MDPTEVNALAEKIEERLNNKIRELALHEVEKLKQELDQLKAGASKCEFCNSEPYVIIALCKSCWEKIKKFMENKIEESKYT